jgi:hypothetical protein
MVIVFVLLLGVLRCSINKYTVWNQGINYVDGTRYIFHSNVQKRYCKVYFQCIVIIIAGRIHRYSFLLVPVLFWMLSFLSTLSYIELLF